MEDFCYNSDFLCKFCNKLMSDGIFQIDECGCRVCKLCVEMLVTEKPVSCLACQTPIKSFNTVTDFYLQNQFSNTKVICRVCGWVGLIISSLSHKHTDTHRKMAADKERLALSIDNLKMTLKGLQADVEEMKDKSNLMLKNYSFSHLKLISLREKAASLELAPIRTGEFFWRVNNINKLKTEPVRRSVTVSPIFYYGYPNYSFYLKVLFEASELEMESKNILSVYMEVVKGIYDDILTWPLKKDITIQLLDLSGKENHLSRDLQVSFEKPTAILSSAYNATGISRFCNLADLFPENLTEKSKYVADDAFFFKILLKNTV